MKIWLLMFLLCLSSFNLSSDALSDSNEDNTIPTIENVVYDYQLFNKNDEMDCKGQLKFIATVPAGAQYLIYEKQGRFFREFQNHPDFIDYNLKCGYHDFTENTVEIDDPEIYWGRYFRVRVRMEDDTWICSENYNTKNYMNEDDLAMLLQSANVADVNTEDINVCIINGVLNIQASEAMDLVITDLRGQIIFTGEVNQSISIPIDTFSTPVIIARYNLKNKIITQKLKIQ